MYSKSTLRTSQGFVAFSAFVNYNLETFMSRLYIKLTDHNGKKYLCDSVEDACLVARYLARNFPSIKMVESNSHVAIYDFNLITNSYFQPKEVSHG